MTTANITVDAAFEEMPATLAVQDIYVSGNTHRLERKTPAEIYDLRVSQPMTAVNAPWYYALNGANRLEVYPTPTSAVTLVAVHVPKPTEMSSDSHDPSDTTYGGIPVEFHPALEEYAKWKMADYDDDSTSQNGLVYQAEYLRLVRDARRAIKQRGGRTLGRAVVGRKPRVPSTPSTDIW